KELGGSPSGNARLVACEPAAHAGAPLEHRREVAPHVSCRLDRLTCHHDPAMECTLAAHALIKEPRRVVAQHPDDRRSETGADEAAEERQQQLAPDPLPLMIGRHVEGEDFAGDIDVAIALRTTAAEPDDGAAFDLRHHHVLRSMPDEARPELAAL